METTISFSRLCQAIGHQFGDIKLLKTAMTHKSASVSSGGDLLYHNERLEFLGDAVLSVVAAEYLFSHQNHFNEGALSRLRAQFVCQQNLSLAAQKIDLGKYILSDKAMRFSGSNNTPAVLSDTLEALIGAVFVDAGLNAARDMILRVLGEPSLNLTNLDKDAKTKLQERVQETLKQAPKYEVLEKSGPAHAPNFVVGVKIDGKLIASASGSSKKIAAQQAATLALKEY